MYSANMDCLGHHVDDRGLHADSDKMERILELRTPRSQHEGQCLVGLVQYIAHFMPDVSAYTSPLEGICRNGQLFYWRPLHQTCLDRIKDLARKTPILRLDHLMLSLLTNCIERRYSANLCKQT